MKFHFPSCYPSFSCIAGACSDTCCACWEVVIDEASRTRYEALPGAVGDRLRAALRRDADGDSYLELIGGRCPMLRDDNLCELQKTHGEEALSEVCARYPRFSYSFGGLTEQGISISCPTACELILDSPFAIEETQNDAPPELNDIDPQLYFAFLRGRKTAFSIAEDAAFSIFERTALLLHLAQELESDPDDADACCANWDTGVHRCTVLAAIQPKRRGDFTKLRRVFQEMEPLSQRFPQLLSGLTQAAPLGDACIAQRLLHYYIYKYFLQAAYDGRLLKRVQYIAASMLMHGALLAAYPPADRDALVDLIHLYARETEHSEQNLEHFYRFAGTRRQKLLCALLLK